MVKCQICKQKFNDHKEAQQVKCNDGQGGHILQEVVIGSINPDDGSRADFLSVGPRERAEWAAKAREIFGDGGDDSY